jgi:hypothetical protein
LLFQQKFQGLQFARSGPTDADSDCLSQFFVIQQAFSLSIGNQPVDRFDGKLMPFLGTETFRTHRNTSLTARSRYFGLDWLALILFVFADQEGYSMGAFLGAPRYLAQYLIVI